MDSRPARDVAAAGGAALAITARGILAGSPGGNWAPLPAGAGLSTGVSSLDALAGTPGSFAVADGFNIWRIAPGDPPRILAPAPPGEATTVLLELPGGRLLGATDRGLFSLDPGESIPAGVAARLVSLRRPGARQWVSFTAPIRP